MSRPVGKEKDYPREQVGDSPQEQRGSDQLMSEEIVPPPTPFKYEGTVSQATMRAEDLVPSFLSVLSDLDPDRAGELETQYEGVTRVLNSPYVSEYTREYYEELDYLVDSLFDALDMVAPPGYYFGAIEGDGSDYGFWAVESEDEESEDA